MDNREFWLGATLVELADTSAADFDEATYSRRLAAHLAELLAPAEVAVLLADGTGRLRAVAASTERAHRLACAEADRGDGPAASCLRTGQPSPGDVSFLPMRRQDETIGVVCVLRAGRHPLDATQAGLARILAEAAAVAIVQQRQLNRSARAAEQLQHALDSRVLIEQAKGAVAARLGIAPEAAFELLRAFARRHSRPLAEVAAETIGGELTAAKLATAPQAGRARRNGSPVQPG